jgi:hypothetical protein
MYSKFAFNDNVIVNGEIMTNNNPKGSTNNNLISILASNLPGIVIDIEPPSKYNNSQYLYTIKFNKSYNGNLYGIEISENKLSLNPNINPNNYNNYNNPNINPNNYNNPNLTRSFYIGQKVFLQNVSVILLNPTRKEFITYKVGFISAVLFGNLYEITFTDNTIATNVNSNIINILQFNSQNNSNIIYQDISEDEELQDDVTDYYLRKTLKWIKKDARFSELEKFVKILKTKKGFKYINKILRKFIIKYPKIKWYDLRDKSNYEDVQDYIRKKLKSIKI